MKPQHVVNRCDIKESTSTMLRLVKKTSRIEKGSLYRLELWFISLWETPHQCRFIQPLAVKVIL